MIFCLWFVVVIVTISLVADYIVAKEFNLPDAKGETAEALMEVSLPDTLPNYRIVYTGHELYFNPDWHIPIAVCYELLGTEADGELPRHKNFEKDNAVSGCASPTDYTRSGYDRGHMAPAGDMKWDKSAMHDSFKMTNICPQNKSLNTGAWNQLENIVRQWAKRDSALIVVCGPIVTANDTNQIGKIGVRVPGGFYKVVLAPFSNPARAIGFIFPNRKCSGKISEYAMSIDDVEQITGLDFFRALPDDEENEIEARCNYEIWTQRK